MGLSIHRELKTSGKSKGAGSMEAEELDVSTSSWKLLDEVN